MRQIKRHSEWVVLASGLILLALMDPQNTGTSFCLFDLLGFEFCPGQGLGHSIALSFRGEFSAAFEAHLAGPFAIVILTRRIISIWRQLYLHSIQIPEIQHYG